MAIAVQEIQRVFEIEQNGVKIQLEDPNASFSANDVRDIYTAQYAELLNSTIINRGIENDKLVYEFKTVAGTKG